MSKAIKVGDKVRYVSKDHARKPEFYPEVGTVGTVKYIDESGDLWIQWPKGSTSGNDCWCCYESDVELISEENTKEKMEMTNKEIWQMLENRMRKNGLVSKANIINTHIDDYPNNEMEIIKAYYEEDVHNAIALAYKVGYLRAMKGRPFKIGEKKKKGGHWVPVDPNNLPKEGTKVRYSRECEDYSSNDEYICINDTGTVKLEGSWFGVTLDNPHRYKWICFDEAEDCLDMWVEDDE